MDFDQITPEVRACLNASLQSLKGNSYLARERQYGEGLACMPRSLLLTEVADFVVAWLERAFGYCQQILELPNLHAPFTGYSFSIDVSEDQRDITVFHSVTVDVEGEQYAEMTHLFLFVFQRPNGRYRVYYSDEKAWCSYVEDIAELGRTPMDALIREGRVFSAPDNN